MGEPLDQLICDRVEIAEQVADQRDDPNKLTWSEQIGTSLDRNYPHWWQRYVLRSICGRAMEIDDLVAYDDRPHVNQDGHSHNSLAKELLRDLFGNSFRPIKLDPHWLTSSVLDLAQGIYEDRAFERIPILADALMDAGCADELIINHCRGPGPHVRGCWVVDLLLGKE